MNDRRELEVTRVAQLALHSLPTKRNSRFFANSWALTLVEESKLVKNKVTSSN